MFQFSSNQHKLDMLNILFIAAWGNYWAGIHLKMTKSKDAMFWHRENPKKSTWLGAFWLASAWTGVYFLVFFLATWIMNLTSPAMILLVGLWLSVIAEGYIRYLENSDKIAKWTKPLSENPKGDNQDFGKSRAAILVMFGLLVFAFFCFVIPKLTSVGVSTETFQETAGSFKGQGAETGLKAVVSMFASWFWVVVSPKFGLGLIFCVGLRTVIYKRLPKSKNETQLK